MTGGYHVLEGQRRVTAVPCRHGATRACSDPAAYGQRRSTRGMVWRRSAACPAPVPARSRRPQRSGGHHRDRHTGCRDVTVAERRKDDRSDVHRRRRAVPALRARPFRGSANGTPRDRRGGRLPIHQGRHGHGCPCLQDGWLDGASEGLSDDPWLPRRRPCHVPQQVAIRVADGALQPAGDPAAQRRLHRCLFGAVGSVRGGQGDRCPHGDRPVLTVDHAR